MTGPGQLSVKSASPAETKLSILGDRIGYSFGLLAVLVTTASVLVLENWIHNANLVLVYVLAVIATGLRHGSLPAMVAATLSFLCFNFFLTEPRYTFVVAHQEELATLIFLFLIAVISGSAASGIRQQFLLLREANRYSEAMQTLGQALSVAGNAESVWLATSEKLAAALQVEVTIAVSDEDGGYATYPNPSTAFVPADIAAIEWTHKHAAPSEHLTGSQSNSRWAPFPVCKESRCIACALIRLDPGSKKLAPFQSDLIQGMLQQAADTWWRIQLASELESARVKTEIEQLRSALLSSVSHDLKSPLAAMMGAAESLRLLDRQLDPQDREELMDTILQESRRLDSYIQNLLDMTRLGYGTLKIERDWVSIADIIGSAITRLKRYYSNIQTDIEFSQIAPLIYVHAALVEQALFNILENAARFTPEGEKIRVVIDANDRKCIISISDKGPGIPGALREKIFDMFYVIADGDKKQQGTGMGLAICRGMIGAHGGSVQVIENPGQNGTKIQVELPLAKPPVDDKVIEE